MSWKTAVAIYLLFWVMSAFLVLPFEARGRGEEEMIAVAGEDRGAPKDFRPRRALIRTTAVSAALFALFWANYIYGWVTVEMLGVTRT